MKTFKNFKIKVLSATLLAAFMLVPLASKAQQDTRPYYANIDWQFNAPISNDFTSTASGWGMNFEGGYYITPKIGVGAFMAFSTNHKYIPERTLAVSNNSALTTDQQRSLFQLPFGIGMRYRFIPDNVAIDPYFGVKAGAEYAQFASYFSTFKAYDQTWGFYLSPEIGTNIWLTPQKTVGLNASVYYSFSTNKGGVLDGSADKLNNIGFRLGLAF